MKITAKRFVIAIITFTIGVSVWGVWFFNDSARGEVYDSWETANAVFKIRIAAYKEMAAFTPGAYYVLQSTAIGSNDWREIITIKTDEPHPIRREQLRFVSDHVAYIFMSTYYIVTTDGGHTWFVWDGNRDVPNGRQYNLSPAPKEVDIQPDGTGRMVLYPFFQEREKGPDLYTTDYGRHWDMRQ